MNLSSTAKTVLRKKNGWRNDLLFENKGYPFAATLSYEIDVLGNLDILYFVFNNYLSEEYKKDKNNFYSVAYHDYFRNGKSMEKILAYYGNNTVCKWLNDYFCEKLKVPKGSNLYCKWLTTVEGYNKVYRDELNPNVELQNYKFSSKSLVASDLGVDGCLIISTTPFILNKTKLIK